MFLALIVYLAAGLTILTVVPQRNDTAVILAWPLLWFDNFYPETLKDILKREKEKYERN